MEQKTKVHAEDGRQELVITREFDLPLHLLFKAYVEPGLVEQWMGTKVLKLDNKKHGSWRFQTTDEKGNILFQAGGVIHDIVPNRQIIRTFQMEHAPFEPQLEFMDFDELNRNTSKLTIQIVYRSVTVRDQMLAMPFAYGINMAHNRLQEIIEKLDP